VHSTRRLKLGLKRAPTSIEAKPALHLQASTHQQQPPNDSDTSYRYATQTNRNPPSPVKVQQTARNTSNTARRSPETTRRCQPASPDTSLRCQPTSCMSSPRLQSGPDGSARHGFMCPKKYLKRSLIFGVGDQHPPSLRFLRRVRGVGSRQVQDPLTFPGIQAAKKHDIPYAMFVVARRIMAAWIESTLPRSTEMPYIPSGLKERILGDGCSRSQDLLWHAWCTSPRW
jgi:hypothetical protein